MTDSLYPGASELEGRAIREVVTLAMDAPAKANSGHSGHRDGAGAAGSHAVGPRHASRPDRPAVERPGPVHHERAATPASCSTRSRHHLGYDLDDRRHQGVPPGALERPGHPERGVAPTVEVTTGPAGPGHRQRRRHGASPSASCAATTATTSSITAPGSSPATAASKRASATRRRRWPAHLGLDRLTIFYDDNHITIDGTDRVGAARQRRRAFRGLRLARLRRRRAGQRPRRPGSSDARGDRRDAAPDA